MAVGIERDTDVGMSKPLLCNLGVDTCRQQMRGMAVAKIVEAYLRQLMPAHEPAKAARQ